MARVVIEHLKKTFAAGKQARVRAVEELNLTVESGELLVLLGPSGCGKTTTLRLIAGLEEPDSGSISIDGQDVTILAPKDRDVAMVFQNHALYPHMNVYENMAFGLMLRKVGRGEIDSRVRETAQLLELTDCLQRKPGELSGGQGQRVALGRALVRRPKLLLLDEPLSNLDVHLRAQLRSMISRLNRTVGCTMIYVTHDQTEAMMLGTRLAVMKEGMIQQLGDPLEVYQRPRNLFVAGFVGWPPMNLWRGKLTRDKGEFCFKPAANGAGVDPVEFHLNSTQLRELNRLEGKEILLGIRPENIGNGATKSGASFEGEVSAIERTGAETFVRLRKGNLEIVARMAPGERVRVNENVRLSLDINAAQLFDAETGQNLGGSTAGQA